jgi:hypothetical protein
MAFEDGPFIQAACFCDIVLEDKTNVLSLIRIIDTITQTAAGNPPPEEMPPLPYNVKLVLMFKSGKARGRHNLKIVPELPDGSAMTPINTTVHFDGEEKGHNQVANLSLIFPLEGLYWFDVFINDEKITSLPLRVKYNRIVVGT